MTPFVLHFSAYFVLSTHKTVYLYGSTVFCVKGMFSAEKLNSDFTREFWFDVTATLTAFNE